MQNALNKMIRGIEKDLGLDEGSVSGEVYQGGDGKYNAHLKTGECSCGGVFSYFLGGGWKTESGFIGATKKRKWIDCLTETIAAWANRQK